ncbi:Symplekin [Bienertia sinuspersici]
MAAYSGERIESLIYTVTFAADTHTTISFYEFLPSLLILLSYFLSPIRKCVTEVIGEIGLRHLQFLSEIIPALSTGLHARKLDDSSESTWEWILKFKGKIYSVAFESGSDGRRLLALKFVPVIILIYTPDPNGGIELPPHLIGDVVGKEVGFNISWIRRGHPMLKLGDLSVEASQSLRLLLD